SVSAGFACPPVTTPRVGTVGPGFPDGISGPRCCADTDQTSAATIDDVKIVRAACIRCARIWVTRFGLCPPTTGLSSNGYVLPLVLRFRMPNQTLVSRRMFLALAGAVPFAVRTLAAARPQVGVELYTVRDELAKDLMGTVRAIAKMGYEVVEFFAPYYSWTP